MTGGLQESVFATVRAEKAKRAIAKKLKRDRHEKAKLDKAEKAEGQG
jgi:hypothetical protein